MPGRRTWAPGLIDELTAESSERAEAAQEGTREGGIRGSEDSLSLAGHD